MTLEDGTVESATELEGASAFQGRFLKGACQAGFAEGATMGVVQTSCEFGSSLELTIK